MFGGRADGGGCITVVWYFTSLDFGGRKAMKVAGWAFGNTLMGGRG